ncbi:YkgJ family cysteine cluster protein [Desulfoluna butyratoxydans]|uniref:Putative zinc- or iron-chelating domain containing protein n=1 Tax=Desulfoluna butyratoxydans TaxID=231438 RepID=A0A4U8YJM4_9BACT|nr:YkgJ family cysteine cluster protein [Desulfoluna butyratoxydans]VFQ43976.1 putative zinc- or iron-chelating domain containing protein [Desulfoluna butyratoxydans]
MKHLDTPTLDGLEGRIKEGETFRFRCHSGLECFNRCCRNLNLFLSPYDVLRLKQGLNITAGEFIDQYTDAVLREGKALPELLLRMNDDDEATCVFLSEAGCTAYDFRPDTCRTFPCEHGLYYNAEGQKERVLFLRPPSFCRGIHEEQELTPEAWQKDQNAEKHNAMNELWGEVETLLSGNTWGAEGPKGQRAKMAFMAAYNVDDFREFIFGSSLLKRCKIKSDLKMKLRRDDVAVMKFGFEWIRVFLLGMPSNMIHMK